MVLPGAGNRPSGLDFGRTATGKTPKSALRPAEYRPEGRFWCFPGPARKTDLRPGNNIARHRVLYTINNI